jgi:hypothetical protein
MFITVFAKALLTTAGRVFRLRMEEADSVYGE